MKYPNSYISYLIEYHATRDYFECHELLEEYWKEHPDDPRSAIWVGLIQLAVGHYHERRGNRIGASKMYAQALKKLHKQALIDLGLDGEQVVHELSLKHNKLSSEDSVPYIDMNLTIIDSELAEQCHKKCTVQGLQWGAASPMWDESLIHRHKLRDRSDVIAARAVSAKAKKQKRLDAK
ncbi:MAG: DUF309 domain-containing protein [Candidatus Pristimantibacillus sp.]